MYSNRFPGMRWHLLYGAYDGIERVAVNEVQKAVQRYLPYLLDVTAAEAELGVDEQHVILVGTPATNPLIAELVESGVLTLPAQAEGYALVCADAPWPSVQRMLVIAGNDAKGVLNGAYDLDARVLSVRVTPDDPSTTRAVFDAMPDFALCEAPAIANRGIWTWGYVIYDYRRYLDNMARLKMNMLVVWNNYPPVNLPEVIDYAHARGIQVIVGFPWGWGTSEVPDLLDPAKRAKLKAEVLSDYREHYQRLAIDGIYFQTCTEHHDKFLGERSTASITCEWVNEVAREFYADNAELTIFFGLHATSIGEQFVDYTALDPRVTIMWEDAGVLPYPYSPTMEAAGQERGTFAETLDYSERLVDFRADNTHFALVPKGWMHLRWESEFEYHRSFILGERSPEFIRRRLAERQPLWDMRNQLWFTLYPYAAQFYRAVLERHPAQMSVAGLVEDGMFEERIQPSVALFAEMIWNPRQSDNELLQRAMSPYYQRD